MRRSRREFLQDVGSGMLIAGLGMPLAGDLGISAAFAGEGTDELHFGALDPLVGLIQETPPDRLQPLLISKLRTGETTLRELIAAAALANAETFGGQDYVGYHSEMALVPALHMVSELPVERQPLPVLKVLYRNAERIQSSGLSEHPRLKRVEALSLPAGMDEAPLLLEAVRNADMQRAEQIFAALMQRSTPEAFNQLLWAIEDNANVHRFVIAHRAWELIDVVGEDHAHTLLRQCVRFCVEEEPSIRRSLAKRGLEVDPLRAQIPRLLDQYNLLDRSLGTKQMDDAWLEEMSQFIYAHDAAESTEAIAAALGEGVSPESAGQAISLAANQLVLRQDKSGDDSWRAHGATPGVHAADATNAWRNMIRIADQRNTVVGLLVAAYNCGGSRCHTAYEPLPHEVDLEQIRSTDAQELLREAEDAICQNDQKRAAAAIAIYGMQRHPARPVFDLMLRYAISEDGRLHSEKFYRTVAEEYATTSEAFRWRHLIALARVTASAYGFGPGDEPGRRAGGYEEACRELNVTV